MRFQKLSDRDNKQDKFSAPENPQNNLRNNTSQRKSLQDYLRAGISSIRFKSRQVETMLQRAKTPAEALRGDTDKRSAKQLSLLPTMMPYSSQGPTLWEIVTKPIRRRRR